MTLGTFFFRIKKQKNTYSWTTSLVSTILALINTIALLFDSVASTTETLQITQRTIADIRSTMYNSIGKYNQTYVLKGSIDIDTIGRRWKVYDVIGIAIVKQPTMRVCTIGLLAKR